MAYTMYEPVPSVIDTAHAVIASRRILEFLRESGQHPTIWWAGRTYVSRIEWHWWRLEVEYLGARW